VLELVGGGVNPCLHPGAVLSASHVASACWPVTGKLDRLKGELDIKKLWGPVWCGSDGERVVFTGRATLLDDAVPRAS